MSFFNELKRRNVFRVAVAYVIISWLLAQIADLMLENFGAPGWVIKSFLGFLIIGFPLVLVFAWAFELTPDGVKRESEVDRSQSITPKTGHTLDRSIIVVLVIALAWFAWDRFGSSPEITVPVEVKQTADAETPADEVKTAKSVAVLPFVAMSSGADDEYFADGLTEEILNSLAQLPELLVTARTSAFHFKGQDVNVQEIATALGVNHIVEGSVRRSGDRLRVTAQLIRAEDGFHLWSESYDSTSEDTISVQEDIAEKIANAMDVVMNDEKRAAMRKAGLRDVEAFIAYQKGNEFYRRAHGEIDQFIGLQRANEYFEDVIKRVPTFAPAYADHSDLYFHIVLATESGQPMTDVTDEMIANAFEYAQNDMAASAQYARTDAERHNAELDLAFLSGNWRGMTGRIEQILNDRGCAESNWLPPIAMVFGYSERSLSRHVEFRNCDPLVSTSWLQESRLNLWLGDASSALTIAQQGDEIAPGNWLSQALIRALVAKQEFDAAKGVIASRIQEGHTALVLNLLVEAARGDKLQAANLITEVLQDTERNKFWDMILFAWSGDQKNADRIAAEIDQRVTGPMILTLQTLWCECGQPWDLSATPNFAATLEEAGLPWPPASPIHFPLKDW